MHDKLNKKSLLEFFNPSYLFLWNYLTILSNSKYSISYTQFLCKNASFILKDICFDLANYIYGLGWDKAGIIEILCFNLHVLCYYVSFVKRFVCFRVFKSYINARRLNFSLVLKNMLGVYWPIFTLNFTVFITQQLFGYNL